MNGEDTKHIEDKELDAFLRGEDGLSQRLHALPQAGPPEALDAAILARAQQAVRPGTANTAAANDATAPGWRPLSRRWRVPAGLAAMLLAGVLTHRTWEETNQMAQVDAPAMTPAPAARPVEQEVDPAEQQVEPQVAPPAAASAPPAQAPAPDVARRAPQAKPRREAQIAEQPAPAPPVAESVQPALSAGVAAPPPAPQPAPPAPPSETIISNASNVKPQLFDEQRKTVTVTGARRAAPAPAVASGATPEDWLKLVEEMLDAGLVRDTLTEWDAFRSAHPDHPVDPALEQRINALRKR